MDYLHEIENFGSTSIFHFFKAKQIVKLRILDILKYNSSCINSSCILKKYIYSIYSFNLVEIGYLKMDGETLWEISNGSGICNAEFRKPKFLL